MYLAVAALLPGVAMQSYFGPRTLRAVVSAIDTLSVSDKPYINYADIAEKAEYSKRSVDACLAYLIKEGGVTRERAYIDKGGAYYCYRINRATLVKLGVLRDSA
jgi:predicted transcriptional regulator